MGPEAGALVVQVESRNGIGRVAVQGDLDMATVPALTEDLGRLEVDGVDAIMLDVRDVQFADGSALRAFLEARNRAALNGHRFLIVGAGRPVLRLFELSGTGALFDEPEAASIIDRFATGSPDGADDATSGLISHA